MTKKEFNDIMENYADLLSEADLVGYMENHDKREAIIQQANCVKEGLWAYIKELQETEYV